MDFTLTLQSSAKTTEKVTEQNTAIRYASGTAPVYATPALVGLMEHAAVLAGDSQLPEGYSTVGISMNVKHLSATPIGLTVHAKAVLTEQDRRKLTFTIRTRWGSRSRTVHHRIGTVCRQGGKQTEKITS